MTDGVGAAPAQSVEAFPGATGKGVRVAVIDSGVNPRHPHVRGVDGGISIGAPLGSNSFIDYLGHGTAVLAAIKEKAPEAEYYAVKIYYRSLKTDIGTLTRALRWAINERMDAINLSLGTPNLTHEPSLAPLIAEAAERGSLIVSAAECDTKKVLPGGMPGVIGVSLDWACPRHAFRYAPAGPSPRWLASGYPRMLDGVPPERNLFGVSFSVANMTAFVVRACQGESDRSLSNITRLLRAEASRLEMHSHKL